MPGVGRRIDMTDVVAQREPVIRLPEQQRRLEAWGVAVTVLVSTAETGGRYSVIEYVSPPTGLGPALHAHREMEEWFLVLEGEMQFQVGEQQLAAAPGSVLHVPPGVPHAFWNAGPASARMVVTMSPGGLEQYFVELSAIAGHYPAMTPEVRPLISQSAAKYDQVILGPSPGAAGVAA